MKFLIEEEKIHARHNRLQNERSERSSSYSASV
jgi:hypothetical protein